MISFARIYSLFLCVCGFAVVPFALHAETSPSCDVIQDARGDVDVQTSSSSRAVSPNRADIVTATFASIDQEWRFVLTTAASIKPAPKEQVSAIVMFDENDKTEDNYWRTTNSRAGADAYYTIFATGSSTAPWALRRYSYDETIAKWRRLNTSSTFSVEDATIRITIPHSELPPKERMRWRSAIAIGASSWKATDEAPKSANADGQCGYLPIPPEPKLLTKESSSTTSSLAPRTSSRQTNAPLAIGLLAVYLAIAYSRTED